MDTAKLLELLVKELPCKVICGEGGPYLSRYTIRDFEDGGHLYLHFFHRSDEDGELHSHPWAGTSHILTGGYVETRRFLCADGDSKLTQKAYFPGDVNHLTPDTFHRVDLFGDNGCWTLFRTYGKEQDWGFWSPATNVFTHWRTFIIQKGLTPLL